MGFAIVPVVGISKLSELNVDVAKDWKAYEILNLADPSLAQSAATRAYILAEVAAEAITRAADDATEASARAAADALRLLLAGGTMSGAIAMGANKITGLADPTDDQDAATKVYVHTQFGKRIVYLKVIADGTVLTAGNNQIQFSIPSDLTGMNLIDANAAVYTPSTAVVPDIRVYNNSDSVNMLSTPISIDIGEYSSYTAAVPPVIDTAHDDVVTGDRISIDVITAGSGMKGLDVILTFQLP